MNEELMRLFDVSSTRILDSLNNTFIMASKGKKIAAYNTEVLLDYLKYLIEYDTGYQATDEEVLRILKGDKLRDWLWLCKPEATLPKRALKRFDKFEAAHMPALRLLPLESN